MSNDAVAYSYINVGLETTEEMDGVAYSFWNLVDRGARNFIGRVAGFAGGPPRIALNYLYVNVGLELVEVLEGVVYSMWNQLEQVSGDTRLLEDGTARLLEDGTTERTLE